MKNSITKVLTIILVWFILFEAICIIQDHFFKKDVLQDTVYYTIGVYQSSVDDTHLFEVDDIYYSYESSQRFRENTNYILLMNDNQTPDRAIDDFVISIFYPTTQDEPIMSRAAQYKDYYENDHIEVTLLRACYKPIEIESFDSHLDKLNEKEIEAIAKTLYGECGSMKSKMHQAAVVWCILNRVDSEDPNFPDNIIDVIEQKFQFVGYKKSNPVREDLYELAKDVLIRWYREKNGEENVGRILPREYMYFHGTGKVNIFKTTYSKKNYVAWDWSLENPYES